MDYKAINAMFRTLLPQYVFNYTLRQNCGTNAHRKNQAWIPTPIENVWNRPSGMLTGYEMWATVALYYLIKSLNQRQATNILLGLLWFWGSNLKVKETCR